MWRFFVFAFLSIGCGAPITAGGYAAADGRAFLQAPKYAGQARETNVSLVVEPEVKLETEEKEHTAIVRPFYRLDPDDDRRSHADLREADYRFRKGAFEAAGGVGVVSWGVLESYRPTDAVNQLDFVESYRGDAKLGQPYAEVGIIGEKISARVYYLPYFRERTFPGLRGRLRFPTLIDDSPQYETQAKAFQPTGAARMEGHFGNLDLGLGLFAGLGREPRFVAEITTGAVAPRYDLMEQISADFQWTVKGFVFKGEGFGRAWSKDQRIFFGGGVGVDYMLFSQLTLAGEYLFDTRPAGAPFTFFEHDAFGGVRLAFDDEASTEVTGGVIVDVVDGTTFAHLEAARRFGDHWRTSLDVNGFLAPGGKLESSFVRDDYARLRIAYYF